MSSSSEEFTVNDPTCPMCRSTITSRRTCSFCDEDFGLGCCSECCQNCRGTCQRLPTHAASDEDDADLCPGSDTQGTCCQVPSKNHDSCTSVSDGMTTSCCYQPFDNVHTCAHHSTQANPFSARHPMIQLVENTDGTFDASWKNHDDNTLGPFPVFGPFLPNGGRTLVKDIRQLTEMAHSSQDPHLLPSEHLTLSFQASPLVSLRMESIVNILNRGLDKKNKLPLPFVGQYSQMTPTREIMDVVANHYHQKYQQPLKDDVRDDFEKQPFHALLKELTFHHSSTVQTGTSVLVTEAPQLDFSHLRQLVDQIETLTSNTNSRPMTAILEVLGNFNHPLKTMFYEKTPINTWKKKAFLALFILESQRRVLSEAPFLNKQTSSASEVVTVVKAGCSSCHLQGPLQFSAVDPDLEVLQARNDHQGFHGHESTFNYVGYAHVQEDFVCAYLQAAKWLSGQNLDDDDTMIFTTFCRAYERLEETINSIKNLDGKDLMICLKDDKHGLGSLAINNYLALFSLNRVKAGALLFLSTQENFETTMKLFLCLTIMTKLIAEKKTPPKQFKKKVILPTRDDIIEFIDLIVASVDTVQEELTTHQNNVKVLNEKQNKLEKSKKRTKKDKKAKKKIEKELDKVTKEVEKAEAVVDELTSELEAFEEQKWDRREAKKQFKNEWCRMHGNRRGGQEREKFTSSFHQLRKILEKDCPILTSFKGPLLTSEDTSIGYIFSKFVAGIQHHRQTTLHHLTTHKDDENKSIFDIVHPQSSEAFQKTANDLLRVQTADNDNHESNQKQVEEENSDSDQYESDSDESDSDQSETDLGESSDSGSDHQSDSEFDGESDQSQLPSFQFAEADNARQAQKHLYSFVQEQYEDSTLTVLMNAFLDILFEVSTHHLAHSRELEVGSVFSETLHQSSIFKNRTQFINCSDLRIVAIGQPLQPTSDFTIDMTIDPILHAMTTVKDGQDTITSYLQFIDDE